MAGEIRVAVIGLDTSHSVEFPRRMQAPDCPEDQKVSGLRTVSCLTFPTPFQSEEGLAARKKQLEEWGIKVTTSLEEAVEECDAVMVEINDPAFHLEYFKKVADLGKPIFLDKPLADTMESGKEISKIVAEKSLRMFSASSLRFIPQLGDACRAVPLPQVVHTYGPLGRAPAGSSIVWYGVHAFEMLQRAMGMGAMSVFTAKDSSGVVCLIEFSGGRVGVAELRENNRQYGGDLRSEAKAVPFVADMGRAYSDLLIEIKAFFEGRRVPVSLKETLEIMGMLDAAQRSFESGNRETI
ncbi:MAG: Gfo/Idh/MocA family oxidoreductase [Candidatus Ratteibacteria bacterium]|jgi:predicted dehydrogenase